MIKRAIIVGFGVIIGARIATRLSHKMREQMHHKMREHCKQMAAQCKQTQSARTRNCKSKPRLHNRGKERDMATDGKLDRLTKEIIAVAVSAVNACGY